MAKAKIKFFLLFNFILIGVTFGQPICRATSDNGLDLHIVHMNDFHARYVETNPNGNECKNATQCIGGFSRNYKQVSDLLQDDPGLVLLNAGDNFQGTIWYTLFKWNVTQYFMNKLHFDAATFGNHEFDDNIDGLIPYLNHITHPMICTNLDDSDVPEIQKLYQKSIIIERCNKKIGIIGVTTSRTPKTSSPGKLRFLDESESVLKEAERLVNENDVFTNIVLSHSGYEVDQWIARNATENSRISVIVGGHSHTLLYNGEPPGWDKAAGEYPTVVERKDGEKVLITQASAFARYLGNFSVTFAGNGSVQSWTGQPIYMANDKPTDESIDKEIDMWKREVDEKGQQVVGQTKNTLSMNDCREKECLIGNFVTDAMVYAYTKRRKSETNNEWTYASMAIANGGGFRNDIPEGNVTFKDLVTAEPFMNSIDVSEIQGKYIQELFEFCANPYVDPSIGSRVNWLQVSGIKVVFASNPNGNTVKSIQVLCQKCDKPNYENLDLDKTYRIITPSFLTNGGDTFTILKDHLTNTEVGPEDLTVFQEYLKEKSPIEVKIEGRLVYE